MLKGYVLNYFETGMEDTCGWAFQEGKHTYTDEYGQLRATYEGLHMLNEGDYLEILTGGWTLKDDERVEHLYWKGTIEFSVSQNKYGWRTYQLKSLAGKKFWSIGGSPLRLDDGTWIEDLDDYRPRMEEEVEGLLQEKSIEQRMDELKSIAVKEQGNLLWHNLLERRLPAKLLRA